MACAAVLALGIQGTFGADSGMNIPKSEVQLTFKVMKRADPKLMDPWEKLVLLHGDKESYTPQEVRDVIGPAPKTPMVYETLDQRPAKVPPGAVSASDAVRTLRAADAIAAKKSRAQVLAETRKEFAGKSREALIAALADAKPHAVDSVAALHEKFQDQPWYLMREVNDARDNGPSPLMEAGALPVPPAPTGLQPIWEGIKHFKIRQSWSDVLFAEDPSQPDTARKKIDDLVGAAFTYTNDRKASTNTWSAVGALVFPMKWHNPVHDDDLVPEQVALVPSITLNRISTNGDASKEVDQLYYRLGGFLSWEHRYGAVELRGAAVYGTDTGNRAELPAYELDIEPQFGWFGRPAPGHAAEITGPSFATEYLKIGYKNIVIKKQPELADQSDNSRLDYQLRTYLHIEGGELQRAGTKWTAVEGSFLRLGPTLQLRVNMPGLILGRDLSFTGFYSYLAAQQGPRENNTLLKLDATLALLNDQARNHKISLNANYTKGGVEFTKEEVDVMTLGLSILF